MDVEIAVCTFGGNEEPMSAEILRGDCLEVMASMPAESVEAIVTDPPYGLGFMGKKWDELPPGPEFAAAALRVLKPGGHLLAFGGTRTYHRLTVAIEDAGFEIRDCLSWLYGSGFPKSHNVSKAIDKAAGAEREVVGRQTLTGTAVKPEHFKANLNGGESPGSITIDLTAPATEDAAKWEGFGTALKPSWEPVVVARKPLIGTVAANVLEHGTGALNIDGCRVAGIKPVMRRTDTVVAANAMAGESTGATSTGEVTTEGRWPANTVLDEDAAAILDEQVGERTARPNSYGATAERSNAEGYGSQTWNKSGPVYADTGGPARFFYVAKASRKERDAGLNDRNPHPTVKPINLMRWLVRMVTPPGGTVLDPFTGSGTTGCAAVLEGFDFVGIEREPEYADIAEARIEHFSGERRRRLWM